MKLKKKLIWFLLAFVIVGTATSYQKGIPPEDLKERYAYSDSHFMELHGMPVHYRISGSGEETIVLLHGTSSSLHTWEEWTNILRSKYRVVSMDMPGFGLTGPAPDNDYSKERYVQFVNSVLDSIGVDSFYLAGNSFGGFVAWNFTVEHPERVKKLILLNSSGYPRAGRSHSFGFWLSGQSWAQLFVQNFTPRIVVSQSVKNAYFDNEKVTDNTINRYFHLLLRQGNRAGLYGRLSQVKNTNSEDISKVDCPTLILWGDQDNLVSVEDAHRFHNDIKNSELVIYENMGHLPMEEDPERSAADLLDFIETP